MSLEAVKEKLEKALTAEDAHLRGALINEAISDIQEVQAEEESTDEKLESANKSIQALNENLNNSSSDSRASKASEESKGTFPLNLKPSEVAPKKRRSYVIKYFKEHDNSHYSARIKEILEEVFGYHAVDSSDNEYKLIVNFIQNDERIIADGSSVPQDYKLNPRLKRE